jgi:hypothetical protein
MAKVVCSVPTAQDRNLAPALGPAFCLSCQAWFCPPLLQCSSYCRATCPTNACPLHDTQHTIKGNSYGSTSNLHGLAKYGHQMCTHIKLHNKCTKSGYTHCIFCKMHSATNSKTTYLPTYTVWLYTLYLLQNAQRNKLKNHLSSSLTEEPL